MSNSKELKPFIKWAGGKGQLLDFINTRYPLDLEKNIKKYCEPFIGGGAVFFDLISKYDFEEILVNDINKELINTYKQIKENIHELTYSLEKIQNEYLILNLKARKNYYYDKRKRFNDLELNCASNINIEKAALFIFLNRTCYNGLYRVNAKGHFNVPSGSYINPRILDEDNLRNINKAFQNINFLSGDFEECRDFIDSKTFLYLDPPYRPISNTSNFTSYTEYLFNDAEQKRLKTFIDDKNDKGARILISNSDPKNYDTNDDFFDQLYSDYVIERIEAKRMINCNSAKRGNISELMIRNYEV